MSSPRRLALIALSLFALDLAACSKADSHPATTTTTTTAPKPAGATTTSAATNAKLPDVLSAEEAVNQFQANQDSLMGKTVKIKGYYFDYTPENGNFNVEITPKPEITSKGPLCVFPASAKAALDKLKKHTVITASGTVTRAFFNRPMLKDCKLE
jgi:hypothetical protein